MTSIRRSAINIFNLHWFWFVFAIAVFVEFLLSPILLLENAKAAELIILFDLCVFIPAVYAFCYRKQQSSRQITLRILGLASLGIFISASIVPDTLESILPNLKTGRYFGVFVVAAVEFFALIALLKMVFSKDTDPAEIAKKSGAPEFVIKLMVMEANFWKAVWKFFNPRK